MSTISLDDPNALQRLKELLFGGEEGEIEVTQGAFSVRVQVSTPEEEQLLEKRPLGLWADIYGPIELSPDFNDELPDSFWLGNDA